MKYRSTQPSFGVALVAVLAGGALSSWTSALFVGFAPYLSISTWSVVTSVFGAAGVKLVLRTLGYEIPWLSAIAALFAGSILSLSLLRLVPYASGPSLPALPAFGAFTGLPALLLSAFVVQLSSVRAHRELPL